MTHEYTILLGGVVLPGGGAPAVSALAWAGDTVLALGSDEAVRAISRGDSHFVELGGARVTPGDLPLEVGGPATFSVARVAAGGTATEILAVVRDGVVVAGTLPGHHRGPAEAHLP